MRIKCTYWAFGIHYYGDMDSSSIEWATWLWKSIEGFEKFEDNPYLA